MTEIIPNLWLGDRDDARQIDLYNVIINCTTELPFYHTNTTNIRINVRDNGDIKQIDIFKNEILDVIKTIHQHITQNQKVLVHCGAGQSRSPTTIACYLLYYNADITVDNAIDYLRKRDSNAFFGNPFFRPVMEYVASLA